MDSSCRGSGLTNLSSFQFGDDFIFCVREPEARFPVVVQEKSNKHKLNAKTIEMTKSLNLAVVLIMFLSRLGSMKINRINFTIT